MIVAWTGHRPDLFKDPDQARATVDAVAREFVEQKAVQFLVGGQRGVDTWAALAAIDLAVPFTVILPFNVGEFTCDWPADGDDAAVLRYTLSLAREMRIANGSAERNRDLATGADLLVAVWAGVIGGGTEQTMRLALEAGTPIREIRLDPSATADSALGQGR